MENVEQFKLLAPAVLKSFQQAGSGDMVHEEVFVTDCVCDALVRKTTTTTASPPNI